MVAKVHGVCRLLAKQIESYSTGIPTFVNDSDWVCLICKCS